MWANILWQLLKWKLSSGLLDVVYDLVLEAEEHEQLTGAQKAQAVWSGLRNSAEVRDVIRKQGRLLVNMAIDVAVARMRRL